MTPHLDYTQFAGCQPDNDSTSGKQYRGVKKLEQVSLGELENYVLESPPTSKFLLQPLSQPHNTVDYDIITHIPQQTQAIEFLCKSKIA
ncbi:hypothetical protein HID58_082756 [Brassica napus]|uniref:Uncharacterized protein n=1 Tax=Brassica napus TaxID=3708 RepID=A0ABQ7YEK4_BRANA|nr:hypothetical protein HID58_082756 [Brassica napus]